MATILVVDDRPSNRQLLTTLLGYGGHRLLEAGNGVEALYQLHEHRPDLLITDILMPTMDGYELVQQLRADPELADIPVIFHTASYSATEARALAVSCGVQHVLPKPCEPEILLQVISEALGTGTPAPIPSLPGGSRPRNASSRAAGTHGNFFAELENAGEFVDWLLATLGSAGGATDTRSVPLPEQVAAQLIRFRRIADLVSALVRLDLDSAAQRDPRRLVEQFFAAACDAIDTRITAVGVFDSDEATLRHVFARGVDPEVLVRGSPDSVLFGALRAGATCIRRPPEPPLAGVLGVAITSGMRAIGWLYYADRVDGENFSDDDERLAKVLAARLGAYYETALQYDVMQRRAAQLQIDAALRRHETAAPQADSGAEKAALPAIPDPRNPASEFLTRRELDVLKLVVDGKSNAQAGSILGLSPRSVETYRGRLMHKLGFHDLPALVKFAIRQGITNLD
jgi:DNA-binding NarL/FixJ family response regulator